MKTNEVYTLNVPLLESFTGQPNDGSAVNHNM
jgi:hypothetical protein